MKSEYFNIFGLLFTFPGVMVLFFSTLMIGALTLAWHDAPETSKAKLEYSVSDFANCEPTRDRDDYVVFHCSKETE